MDTRGSGSLKKVKTKLNRNDPGCQDGLAAESFVEALLGRAQDRDYVIRYRRSRMGSLEDWHWDQIWRLCAQHGRHWWD